eukprot:scaffold4516_cov417-Prasinococcus_capsulatus_cf.AAC.2
MDGATSTRRIFSARKGPAHFTTVRAARCQQPSTSIGCIDHFDNYSNCGHGFDLPDDISYRRNKLQKWMISR